MEKNNTLVKELSFLLEKGNAHAPFEEAVADLPPELLTVVPDGLPYSIWQLVEHIRITQWDILMFCLTADHISPEWPAGYWPAAAGGIGEKQWRDSLEAIRNDRTQFITLLQESAGRLLAPLPHDDSRSLLREALVLADHNAYHCGQIIAARRLLHCWT